jgi:hypothetical protein
MVATRPVDCRMEPDANPPLAHDDPAGAFAALRGEVSLLRRAVEGLTVERQNTPDYTPTLTGLSSRLAHVEELLGRVAESPAMCLTPGNLAVSIAKACETARSVDRESLEKAGAVLKASIASIMGLSNTPGPLTANGSSFIGRTEPACSSARSARYPFCIFPPKSTAPRH